MLGAFKRWGITNHSKRLSFVLKSVFQSSPGQILIWWYPLLRSILEKIEAPPNWSSKYDKRGIGNLYLIAILLIAPLSTHNCHEPSFWGASKAGTMHELRLGWMWPLSRLCICVCKASYSFGLILKWGKLGKVLSGIKSVVLDIS